MPTIPSTSRVALKNILYATDFSRHANAALPYALAIAQRFSAFVYGIYVLPSYDYLFVSPEAWPGNIQQQEQLQQDAIARLEEQLEDTPHRSLCRTGFVWDELQRLVGEHEIDLLVVGSHGRTGTRKLVMGSIAERIFRQASCPVLTVGPNAVAKPDNLAAFKHVLLATDFGEESGSAASYATSIAREHEASLSLIHVIDRTQLGKQNTDFGIDSLMRRLHGLVPPDAELHCNPEYYVQLGPAPDRILQFSETHGVDLIVMGVHAVSGPVNAVTHFAHTTAQCLVAHARCPILTVSRPSRHVDSEALLA